MKWNLYEDNQFLNPICFSNGKNQSDVVEEVLKLIKKGKKIIFIHGICGTGKSAIALNLAKELGKTSIVVPGKNLQNQYKKDYEGKKYLMKENGQKLKISVITGRNNHECPFLKDSKEAIPKIKKEINMRLGDIFSSKRKKLNELISKDISAENSFLPCKIDIRESNWKRIKEYIKQNPKVDLSSFSSIKDVKRLSIAPVCPYWSPVFPATYEINLDNVKKKYRYMGLKGEEFIYYRRKPGCKFYEQFLDYVKSDVLVFNSLKYKLETILLRKPSTEIEIIDECDEFLDSFTNESTINLDRFQNSLIHAIGSGEGEEDALDEAMVLLKHFRKDKRLPEMIKNSEIVKLKLTSLYDLFKLVQSKFLPGQFDDESYIQDCIANIRLFTGLLEETYVILNDTDNGLIAKVVTTNLEKRFKELVDKNKSIVLMSGTIHSREVLENIFGLKDIIIVDAEVEGQGEVIIKKTGYEFDCKYSNFEQDKFTREDYLVALDKSIEIAKRPTLVHVQAYNDLPNEREIIEYGLKNLIDREVLREEQKFDKTGQRIIDFKNGKIDVLFSTRDSRGIDFPGTECNSIVFTKYPNPNVKNPFWNVLAKTNPADYWSFYKDKARREFVQKVYRGLRFKEDKVELLSPDIRVLEMGEREFKK